MSRIAVLDIAVTARRPAPGDGVACLGAIDLPEAAGLGLTLWADGRLIEVRDAAGQAYAVDMADVAVALGRAVAAHLRWAAAAQAAARGFAAEP